MIVRYPSALARDGGATGSTAKCALVGDPRLQRWEQLLQGGHEIDPPVSECGFGHGVSWTDSSPRPLEPKEDSSARGRLYPRPAPQRPVWICDFALSR